MSLVRIPNSQEGRGTWLVCHPLCCRAAAIVVEWSCAALVIKRNSIWQKLDCSLQSWRRDFYKIKSSRLIFGINQHIARRLKDWFLQSPNLKRELNLCGWSAKSNVLSAIETGTRTPIYREWKCCEQINQNFTNTLLQIYKSIIIGKSKTQSSFLVLQCDGERK